MDTSHPAQPCPMAALSPVPNAQAPCPRPRENSLGQAIEATVSEGPLRRDSSNFGTPWRSHPNPTRIFLFPRAPKYLRRQVGHPKHRTLQKFSNRKPVRLRPTCRTLVRRSLTVRPLHVPVTTAPLASYGMRRNVRWLPARIANVVRLHVGKYSGDRGGINVGEARVTVRSLPTPSTRGAAPVSFGTSSRLSPDHVLGTIHLL